jgi:sugar lactone lactonase YvrE
MKQCLSSLKRSSFSDTLRFLAAATAALLLAGCGVASNSASDGVSAGPAEVLTGRVQGGQQPIQNAAIYLYAAGATGNGTGATNLLTKSVSTAADGSFSITKDYTCPASATQVYLVGAGGNPGISASTNNTASLLMAALGDCGNLSASSYIFVDEVTTGAAAWALAQFLGPNANVGSSATNANGLRNAFLVANNLANNATGTAGGMALPAGAIMESAKLNSLANSLAACVNSNGGAACSPLFAAATENSVTPANTLDAALAIVRNPAGNVTAVYNAATATPPFQAALPQPPHDWTMSITYTGGGIFYPTAIAIDSKGNAWIANYFGASMPSLPGVATKLSATGVPASATGFADPALDESYGLAVDTQDNVWIANSQSSYSSNTGYGTISKFSSSGQLLSGSGYTASIYFPFALAGDSNGDMWVADNGNSHASLLNSSGASLAGASGYSLGKFPEGVAVDGSHNAWFATEDAASRVSPTGTVSQYVCCSDASAVAIDANGAVWLSDYAGSAVVQLSSAGTLLQKLTSGGLNYPEDLAIDGSGFVWVANYRGNNLSEFSGATGGAPSSVLSPSGGLGVDAGLIEPFGIALDASGNAWVTSFASASVTQFVGLTSPVKTPLLGPATQP